MGTAVGAVAFCFLCLRPELQPLLLGTFGTIPPPPCEGVSVCAAACADAAAAVQSHAVSLDAARLTLLAAYGLVYCYVASAPILVFHAGRFLVLEIKPRSVIKSKAFYPCALFPFVLGVLVWLFEGKGISFALTAFALVLLLELQFVVVCLSICWREKLFMFYESLAGHREKTKGEIVESYRHLREHGNSFFIVFLEVALGVVLFQAAKLAQDRCNKAAGPGLVEVYLLVFVAWILPAVCVWLISTLIEGRFKDSVIQPGLPPWPPVG